MQGQIPTEIGNCTKAQTLYLNNNCLQVSDNSIKEIKGLPAYKKGNTFLTSNCITKAQLPNANITETNCTACQSCKSESISSISISGSKLTIDYSLPSCK